MMSEIDDIISELSDIEKRIFTTIGRINGSPNRNFHRENLKRKSTDEELLYIDEAIKKFKNLGLIKVYRAPDNFAATKLGFIVAQKLREDAANKKYGGMRIIRR